jgi:hypothetical protein
VIPEAEKPPAILAPIAYWAVWQAKYVPKFVDIIGPTVKKAAEPSPPKIETSTIMVNGTGSATITILEAF